MAGGFYGLPGIKYKVTSDMPAANKSALINRDKALKSFIDEYKNNELEDKIKSWKQKYPSYSFKSDNDYSHNIYMFFFDDLIKRINEYFNLKVDETIFNINMKPVQYEKDLYKGNFESMIDKRLNDLEICYDKELQRYYRDLNQNQ